MNKGEKNEKKGERKRGESEIPERTRTYRMPVDGPRIFDDARQLLRII